MKYIDYVKYEMVKLGDKETIKNQINGNLKPLLSFMTINGKTDYVEINLETKQIFIDFINKIAVGEN